VSMPKPIILLPRLPPTFWHCYWSFDLAPPTSNRDQFFCEVIFHYARKMFPVPGAGLPASLGINDIVAIAMGAYNNPAEFQTPFEEGLPQLNMALSQGLGPTTVTLNNGVATLTALNLRVDLGGLHNNFMQVSQVAGSASPPVQVNIESNLGGDLLGWATRTFQAKHHWISFLAPTTFVQPIVPNVGEFPQ
jgi:hypothetical protein